MKRRTVRKELLRDGRVVARKIAKNPAQREQMLREADVLQAVEHPGIVKLLAMERDALLLEFVEGVELSALYRPAFAFGAAIHVTRSLLEALAAVHRAGYVHCDVTPRNIMVQPDGVVKLIDFGIAFRKGTVLDKRYMHGTPAYVSPEQAKGRAIDERADLYAVGVILYELITGTVYRSRSTNTALAQAFFGEGKGSPRVLRRETPMSLTAIIEKMLKPIRRDRYRHAGEIIAALPPVRDDDQPQLITEMTRAKPPRQRLHAWFLASAAATAAAASMVISGTHTRLDPPPKALPAQTTSALPQQLPVVPPTNETTADLKQVEEQPPPAKKRARKSSVRRRRRAPREQAQSSATVPRPTESPRKHTTLEPIAPPPQRQIHTLPKSAIIDRSTTVPLGSTLSTAHCYGYTNMIDRSDIRTTSQDCPVAKEFTPTGRRQAE